MPTVSSPQAAPTMPGGLPMQPNYSWAGRQVPTQPGAMTAHNSWSSQSPYNSLSPGTQPLMGSQGAMRTLRQGEGPRQAPTMWATQSHGAARGAAVTMKPGTASTTEAFPKHFPTPHNLDDLDGDSSPGSPAASRGLMSGLCAGLGLSGGADGRHAEEVIWEVETAPDRWEPYAPHIQQQLTRAASENRRTVEVQDGRNTYTIELRLLEQRDKFGQVKAIQMRPTEDSDADANEDIVDCSFICDPLRGFPICAEAQRRFGKCRQTTAIMTCLVVAVLVAIIALHALSKGSAAITIPGVAPANRSPKGPWRMCQASGDCSGADLLKGWKSAPSSLAPKVSGLHAFPAVSPTAWEPLVRRWRASAPWFKGKPVSIDEVTYFMRDLLLSDPFQADGKVPFVDLRPPGDGKVVVVTQRQLAFVVANVLMGNSFADGSNNGLAALLQRCGKMAGTSSYLLSLLSFLAVMSQELQGEYQGSTLIVATPAPDDGSWRQRLGQDLVAPTICQHSGVGGTFDCGLNDFMAGGTPHQALVDIAGGVIGGGGDLCEIANTQDESLVHFYSEVLALSFFTSAANPADPASSMLPVPAVIIGARRYVQKLEGQSIEGKCGAIPDKDWLNQDLVNNTVRAMVADRYFTIATSAFVAQESVCSECRAGATCSLEQLANNACDIQRRHVDEDLALWYVAFQPAFYNPAVQEALSQVVTRIGTGPWGAGAWHGDSQQYFLTVWLATGLTGKLSLDYYVYGRFCENAGNQCFVLGEQGKCADCVTSGFPIGPETKPASCGKRGIVDVVQQFQGRPMVDLYNALKQVPPPPGQIFDQLEGK